MPILRPCCCYCSCRRRRRRQGERSYRGWCSDDICSEREMGEVYTNLTVAGEYLFAISGSQGFVYLCFDVCRRKQAAHRKWWKLNWNQFAFNYWFTITESPRHVMSLFLSCPTLFFEPPSPSFVGFKQTWKYCTLFYSAGWRTRVPFAFHCFAGTERSAPEYCITTPTPPSPPRRAARDSFSGRLYESFIRIHIFNLA